MPKVEGFPDRDGLTKLLKLAKAMCATVALFAPILIKKYPGNETIAALLAAIATMCALIPEVESEFFIPEGTNEDVIADPDSTPGIDPGRPAAPEGDIT